MLNRDDSLFNLNKHYKDITESSVKSSKNKNPFVLKDGSQEGPEVKYDVVIKQQLQKPVTAKPLNETYSNEHVTLNVSTKNEVQSEVTFDKRNDTTTNVYADNSMD